jgi:hypothetical protein
MDRRKSSTGVGLGSISQNHVLHQRSVSGGDGGILVSSLVGSIIESDDGPGQPSPVLPSISPSDVADFVALLNVAHESAEIEDVLEKPTLVRSSIAVAKASALPDFDMAENKEFGQENYYLHIMGSRSFLPRCGSSF